MRASERFRAGLSGSWGPAAVMLAVAMLALGVPRLAASLLMVSGDAALRAVEERRAVATASLERAVAAQAAAARWIDSGRLHADLGLLRLMMHGRRTTPGGPDAQDLARATAVLEQGLALAPANPYGWTRLAVARLRAGAEPAAAAHALTTSLITGPHEPELIDVRFRLILDFWRALPADSRDLARRQIRYAFALRPGPVVDAADGLRERGIVRAALAADPRLLAMFERELAARRR